MHDRASTIGEAIKSVQDQTYENWELIIVDDGSKDNIYEIMQELVRKDHRIRFLRHEKNKGAQAARNTGIKAAKGDWIAFLDSDDQWLPESLEMRLKVAKKENVKVVHSRAFIIYPRDRKELYNLPALSGWIHKEVLSGEGPMFQSLLVKKQALEQIRYLDESIPAYQEWDTAIRLAKYFPFGFEPNPTFIYDYRTSDAISRDAARAGRGYERIVRKHLIDILAKTGWEAVWNHYAIIANWYRQGNARFDFLRCKLICLLGKKAVPKRIARRLIWAYLQ